MEKILTFLILISGIFAQNDFFEKFGLKFDFGDFNDDVNVETTPAPVKSVNTLEQAIKKTLQDQNKKVTKSGRLSSNFGNVDFTDLCESRPENNQCCPDNDLCPSSSQNCECDAGCKDREDCCSDYINLCENAIPVPSCQSSSDNTTIIGYVTGDPHYQSFDGRALPYQGACAYTITKLCLPSFEDYNENRKYFEISARNEKREPGDVVTWTKDIWLEYTSDDGFVVKVELLKGRIAVFNGEVVKTLPMQKGSEFNDLVIYRAGRFLSVETNFGVKLMFDGDGSAQVHLNCQYANLQCGLLGNADSDPSNDYETPDGILLTSNDKKQYGDSWLLPSEDPARCEQETSEPECSEEDLGKAVKVCEKVKQDPFTICHNAVQFSNTLMSCMYDTCASNDTQIYCYHLQNYYDQCELAGIDNFLWRNVTNCPLECGINEKFESCGCDSTCAEGKCDANIKCNEGCFCKPGFVRNPSNNECVSESTCRCQFETTDPDDTNRTMTLLLEKNQSLVTKNCTKRCRCLDPLGNKQRCLDMSCEATQECNKIQKIDYDKYDKPMDEVCKLKPDKPDKLWCVKPSKNLGPPDPEWVAPNACCGSKPYNTNKKFCCVEDRLSKTPCTKKRR